MADTTLIPVHHDGREASSRFATALVAAIVVFAIVLRVVSPGRVAWIQAALIVFGSLLIQALPFVLIGALASAAIEVFDRQRPWLAAGNVDRHGIRDQPFEADLV